MSEEQTTEFANQVVMIQLVFLQDGLASFLQDALANWLHKTKKGNLIHKTWRGLTKETSSVNGSWISQ